MRTALKMMALMSFGAFFYGGFELFGRGYTHISMGVLGGIALCIIHLLNDDTKNSFVHLAMNAAVSAFFITSCELLTGEILNRGAGMHIWDYSNLPFNFDGQVCVLFSMLWFMLSLVGLLADMLIRRMIFRESYIQNTTFDSAAETQVF